MKIEFKWEVFFTVIFEIFTDTAKSHNSPRWLSALCAFLASTIFLGILLAIGCFAIVLWNAFYYIPSFCSKRYSTLIQSKTIRFILDRYDRTSDNYNAHTSSELLTLYKIDNALSCYFFEEIRAIE
jgi:hypothetical protein